MSWLYVFTGIVALTTGAAQSEISPKTTGKNAMCNVIEVGDGWMEIPPQQLARPICLHVDTLYNVPSVVIEFEQYHATNPLCIVAQGYASEKPQCASGSNPWIPLQLVPPTEPRDYTFFINRNRQRSTN